MRNLEENRTPTCQFCGHVLRRSNQGQVRYVCLLKNGETKEATDTCEQFDVQQWTTIASKIKKMD